MHVAFSLLPRHLACYYDSLREKRSASSAYLLGLLHHKSLSCCHHSFHLWSDWTQHTKHAEFHNSAFSGELALCFVRNGRWDSSQPWEPFYTVCLGSCWSVSDRGTTLNYLLDNRINNAAVLFPGVGCFLIAVLLASAVHSSNASDNRAKLCKISEYKDETVAIEVSESQESVKKIGDLEDGGVRVDKAKAGTANFLIELENRRSIKVFGKSTMIGLCLPFFSGVCFSLFSPAFNLATNDQWHTLKAGVPHLVVYTAFFYFSISCFIIAIILNVSFLYHPVLNLPRTSFKAYLNDWKGRQWALLAGLLCGFGNGLQFMGGQAAGYAAADAVQALPLVSTFWGILLFGEYRMSSRKTYIFLVSMIVMFIVAVGVLMASSGTRTN
ncbi:ureide permease 1-like isoform X5 [Macadamia integrifolia]|uniref:ureide permease 1-like isoform X5 n=1 Tax=Macadamia integrifolia TaxID=60698 RepID=UPI001C4F91EF|nr:ureide permease 1-like isoform X5 [Macadamia integrifolia]